MIKNNGQTYLNDLALWTRFLKNNWQFFNITNESVNCSFVKDSSFLQKKSEISTITFQFEKTTEMWLSALWLSNLTIKSQQLRCF